MTSIETFELRRISEIKSKPFVPSFYKNYNFNTPDEVVSYVLDYYVRTPANIFDNYSDYEISFVNDNSIAGGDLDKLRELVIDSLTGIISRYYPNLDYLDIDVSYTKSKYEVEKRKNLDTRNLAIEIKVNLIVNGKTFTAQTLRNLK